MITLTSTPTRSAIYTFGENIVWENGQIVPNFKTQIIGYFVSGFIYQSAYFPL